MFGFGLMMCVVVVVRVMVVIVGTCVKLLTSDSFCGGFCGYFFFAC